MRVRQQSTSTYHIPIYLVLSSDHISAATGKTVSVTLSKNSAAFGAASGAVTEVSSGVYKLAANATDTDTLGSLTVLATATGCDPYLVEYTVVPYNPFDAVRMGLTALPNAAAEAAGGLLTRGTGTGQITVASGAVTVGTNNDKTGYTASTVSDKTGYTLSSAGVQAIWDALTAALTTASSIGKLIKDNLDAAISSRLATSGYTAPLSGAQTAAAVLDAVAADYNDAGSIGAAINDAAAAGGASAADIADAVWDEVIAGHATAGSTGAKLSAAASAGDPLSTDVPGAYTGNQAGKVLADIKAKTDVISGAHITVTSPVVDGADITIVRGDDYANADGRALFAGTTFSNAPSLSGGSVTLKVQTGATTTFTKAGVVTGAAACYVELTDAETAAMSGKKSYDLEATLSNGDVVTIAQGKLIVEKDVR